MSQEAAVKKQKVSDLESFLEVFPILRDFILEDSKNFELPTQGVEYMRKLMDYTVPGGKMTRGLTVLASLQSIASSRGETVTEEQKFKARVLGWTVEWLQAFFLVADDVMDSSITRRGNPCWYKLPEIQMNAVNDCLILESAIYRILRHYFRSAPYYGEVVSLMQEVTYATEFGQLLDLTSQEKEKPIDLNRFTLDLYKKIVKYKTAFYSFYLPVALGMCMAGITDEKLFALAKQICVEMGEYFQIQDDYLDCYADPAVLGKIGTDIQDCKCSWLVVQALQRANAEQKKILEENYGKKDETCVATIKQLYRDLDLEKIFQDYENESYTRINAIIDSVAGMPRSVFTDLLAKIYKRQK